MSDPFGFEKQDADERIYAPEELPADEQTRVRADEGRTYESPDEPPSAAPVASIGTGSSAVMAPPNIGHGDRGGGPGDPAPMARDPLAPDPE